MHSAIFNDHIANPRNVGELSDASAVAEETNPVCGDRLRLSLRIHEDRIEAARFLGYGCAATLVCGSVMSEMIEGLSVEAASMVDKKQLLEKVGGLPQRKRHAAALAIETLKSALAKLLVIDLQLSTPEE